MRRRKFGGRGGGELDVDVEGREGREGRGRGGYGVGTRCWICGSVFRVDIPGFAISVKCIRLLHVFNVLRFNSEVSDLPTSKASPTSSSIGCAR